MLLGPTLAATAPAAGQESGTAPDAVTCACSIAFDYADAERYRYWRREAVAATMEIRLSRTDGVYQAAAGNHTALCEDVREERRGEPFRTVDMCVHLGEWLVRVREEMRCDLATDDATRARCRLPDPDPDAGRFLNGTGQGADPAAAICDALDAAIELRLTADLAAFEAERLHGLPDVQHHHSCRPK
ncbi:hypothetical protein ACFOGJ_22315 [Marinibaculum pumilum]|uniref:Secreted protein n=1 Tax=Marinibaculum pumilum TaxID=1766165 RepID=A0ABV7L5W9_9PROT